ncbi:hypothetical protein M2226_003655 [Bradyrhizobium elkanii]|uniref:hypothetical protein n=1 Tax=Bradyrhizobium elkanii TaxID=29448 RepID=UPI0022268273|nr:hypothetical protein [Bradyrhizobium elkanii]MCW2124911.1 hypothetical protein [Bradyrhizobium elkanii]MCW2171657.1 hypothetical protein [Bradyrhizobium elkanii]
MSVDLEPFIELPGRDCAGHASDAYRFGYRSKETGVAAAMVEIAAVTVAQFVPLQVSARMTIDGKIVIHAQLPDVDHGTLGREYGEVSLIELVEAALNVDNLRMEEAGPRELRTFLRALEISIQRVKVALAAI